VAQSGSFSARFVPLERPRGPPTVRAQITVLLSITSNMPRRNLSFFDVARLQTYATQLKASDFAT